MTFLSEKLCCTGLAININIGLQTLLNDLKKTKVKKTSSGTLI